MNIEPRLMERRRTVAEDNAKRNVGRLLRFLAVLVLVGAAVWFTFSPWLSVSQVDTTGIAVSSANSILADRGVVAGTPMVRISAIGTERALLGDPWIASAEVDLHWPDRVSVEIVERTPIAWTLTSDGWTRRAVDGVALPSGSEPDADMARVEMPRLIAGEVESDPDMAGALEFVESLAPRLRPDTVVFEDGGELWATVNGHEVRLGRGVDMVAKALSLQALLEEDIPENATLVLIAPTNPAVTTPGTRGQQQQTASDEETDAGSGEREGSADVEEPEAEEVDDG
jgi:hypothetical protein